MTTTLLPHNHSPATTAPPSGFSTTVLSHGESLRYAPAWTVLQQAYERDPLATFDQQPESIDAVLFATAEWDDRPAVIVHREATDGEPHAAVFIPKNVSTKKIPAFGFNCTLRGHRLAGNRLLGPSQAVAEGAPLVAASLATLARHRSPVVLIEDLDVESPLSQIVADHLPRGWQAFAPRGTQARHRLFFPAENRDSYWEKFSSKTRNTFRRTVKKIGDIKVVKSTTPADVADFLRDAHRVSRETWQSQTLGLRIKNDDRELAVFGATATLGAFRSYLLYRDHEPIAFVVGIQSHGTFLLSELGYDPRISKQSPGQVLLLKILDDLVADPQVRELDFGFGDAGYKQMFGTHVSQSADVWLMPDNGTTKLVRAWGNTTQCLVRTSKRIANRFGVASAVKKGLRKFRSTTQKGASNE